MAAVECVLITAPDRLARNYVHQMLLVDELTQRGCRVEFVERPMSNDPHDQLGSFHMTAKVVNSLRVSTAGITR
jgi:DNA invertase Pin-like site-specific DNA recombinase